MITCRFRSILEALQSYKKTWKKSALRIREKIHVSSLEFWSSFNLCNFSQQPLKFSPFFWDSREVTAVVRELPVKKFSSKPSEWCDSHPFWHQTLPLHFSNKFHVRNIPFVHFWSVQDIMSKTYTSFRHSWKFPTERCGNFENNPWGELATKWNFYQKNILASLPPTSNIH